MEEHHGLSVAIGGTLVGVSITALVALIIWADSAPDLRLWASPGFDATIGFLCLCLLAGFYILLSPWLGLPVPPTRTEPIWRRSSPEVRVPPSPAPDAADRPAPQAHPGATVAESPTAEPRTLVTVTPGYLTGLFEGRTAIQAKALVEPFLGRWIAVEGEVQDVSVYTTRAAVSLRRSSGQDVDIICLFGLAWVRDLSTLAAGNRVAIVGQIEEVKRHDLWLQNCELR